MGRKRLSPPRDPAEYRGARWVESDRQCPRCAGPCRVLQTGVTGRVRGLECKDCGWSQYPGNPPTLGSTPESRRVAAAAADEYLQWCTARNEKLRRAAADHVHRVAAKTARNRQDDKK